MKEFKIGQTLYSPMWEGVLGLQDNKNSDYPFFVETGGCEWTFTKEGQLFKNGPIILFHNPVEVVEKKWQPKEGEWCLFYNDWGFNAALDRLNRINTGQRYEAVISGCWDCCAPFTGELPEHLKDIK